MKKKTKTLLLCLGIFVLLTVSSLGIWFLTRDKEPVNQGNVLGIAWYDENGTEFTIDTIEELKELAALSEHYNFKGQTIKLGADLVDNEGNATDWEEEVPDSIWEPIKNFAGTFDGQGHTISGICGYGFVYLSRGENLVEKTTGLFTSTQATCEIKDFRLVNSFFYGDFNGGVGSITSNGGGTFDSIYSSAIVLSYKQNTGGLIGQLNASGSHTVTNCWFDGELRVEGNFGSYAGGIVGRVCDTKGQVKIEHCLNTGTATSSVKDRGVNLGGIVGNVAKSGRLSIKDCLNVGSVSNEYGVAVGSVLGCVSGAVTIQDVYTTTNSYAKVLGATLGTANGLPMEYSETLLRGYGGYQWTTLDFEKYWAVVEEDTPTLKYFTENIPSTEGIEKNFDLTWYDKTKSELVITNMKQLYGFSILSRSTNFEGKTVKLGADIVVNEGAAKDWAKEAPTLNWVPIATNDVPFAGVFDGDMHTISGVYLKTEATYGGLFCATTDEAVVKNLKLVNSYFESDAASFGSVSGRGRGVFDTIYSNAIVVGHKTNLGGIVGQIPGDCSFKMNNCWFDGTVKHNGNTINDRRTGGLIGVVYSDITVSNCLNTGLIDVSKYTALNKNSETLVVPSAGGIVGIVGSIATMTIRDCLNVGEIKVSSVASAGYGSVIGYVEGYVKVSNTYGTKESSNLNTLRHSLSGEIALISKSELKGYSAYQWTLLDFDKYWAVAKTGTPILKSFASEVPSLAKVRKLYDIGWYNESKKTYVLDSIEDLHGFFLLSYNTNFEGKTVKLGADIAVNSGDATTWAQKAPTYTWKPIGSNNNPFKGTFDGQMHSISGLYLKTDAQYGGFFAVTAEEATVKNLRLTNSYFETSAHSFASISGRGRGVFDTIYSNAIVVSSTGNVGGIVGQVPSETKITVRNCWFDGRLIATGNTSADKRFGGMIGVSYSDAIISNCLNTGTIDATKFTLPNSSTSTYVVPLAGGIIGSIPKDVKATIDGCLNVGRIEVSNAANTGFGPIVGWKDGSAIVKDTYAISTSCDSFTTSRINDLVISMENDMMKGYGAYQWTFLDFEKYWSVVMESTPILKSFAGVVPSLAGVDKMIDYSWMEQAKGTEKDPYILADAADLYGFAKLSRENDFAGKTIRLGADIVINKDMNNPSYAWTPIGTDSIRFAGTFDGLDPKTGEIHSISGLYLKTNDRYVGLFSNTTGDAVLKNFSLEDSYIETTAADCGGIIGCGSGVIDTVKSSVTIVSSNARVGGFIGQANRDSLTMNNCWFDGNITVTGNDNNKKRTGGLIGLSLCKNVKLTNCLNTATIDATAFTVPINATSEVVAPMVGGLVGQVSKDMTMSVKHCLNTGAVLCSSEALKNSSGYGSVIGYSEGAVNLSETYATSESCKIASGGLARCITGKTFQKAESSIKGYDGYQWTTLNFDTKNGYWAVVLDDENTTEDESGVPILQSFANSIPSLAEIDQMIAFEWYETAKGTEEDPYILKTSADLYGLAMISAEDNFANKFIRLGADIVVNEGIASEWKTTAPSATWIPIGTDGCRFEGTFNGMDLETNEIHSISGLYLNTTSRFGGLFAYTTEASKVLNLKLKNSYFKSTAADFGSIAGQGKGEFNTIYSNAIVECSQVRTGGMLGQSAGADTKITNCWFAGTYTNVGTTQENGGLVGTVVANTKLTMTDCLNTGTVKSHRTSGNERLGGMIGYVAGNATANVEDCLNVGLVQHTTSTSANVYGPIVGRKDSAGTMTITDTYATTESARDHKKAGIDGKYTTVAETGIIGSAAKTKMSGLEWATAINDAPWTALDYRTPVLTSFKNESDGRIDVTWYAEAEGTAEDPYVLDSAADLYGLAILSKTNHFSGKTIELRADVTINSGTASADWSTKSNYRQWIPIGLYGTGDGTSFEGTFDGKGHTISGLYLKTSERYAGLFGRVGRAGVVKNIRLENSYLESSNREFGGIAGLGRGRFYDVYNSAIMVANSVTAGGFVGQISNSGNTIYMENCWFAGTLTNNVNSTTRQGTGGLIGYVYAGTVNMTNCMNSGTISMPKYNQNNNGVVQPNLGGLVGSVNSSNSRVVMNACVNVGNVPKNNATKGYGALVGWNNAEANVTMTATYATNACAVSEAKAMNNLASTIGYVVVAADDVKADAAAEMPLLGWNVDWKAISGAFPRIIFAYETSTDNQ